jgi:hypothetical protein
MQEAKVMRVFFPESDVEIEVNDEASEDTELAQGEASRWR